MCLLDFYVNFQLRKLLNFNPISFQVSLICFLLLRFIYQLKCVISYMAPKSTLICSIIYSFNKYCIYCESDSARSLGLNNEQKQLGVDKWVKSDINKNCTNIWKTANDHYEGQVSPRAWELTVRDYKQKRKVFWVCSPQFLPCRNKELKGRGTGV